MKNVVYTVRASSQRISNFCNGGHLCATYNRNPKLWASRGQPDSGDRQCLPTHPHSAHIAPVLKAWGSQPLCTCACAGWTPPQRFNPLFVQTRFGGPSKSLCGRSGDAWEGSNLLFVTVYALSSYLASYSSQCLQCGTADAVCCVTWQTMSAWSHCRQCLLCHTADIVCCVTQQTMSAVSHSRNCLLCDMADEVCMSHSRQCLLCGTTDTVRCVTQQTMSALSHSRQCLLCPTADIVCCVTQQTMSAVSHSRQGLLHRTAKVVCCVTQQTMAAKRHSKQQCTKVR